MNTQDDLIRALSMPGTAIDDPFVVCWRDLDDATTTEELDRLMDWVEWFTTRYRLDHKVVPPCWHQHGAITEELSALRTFWESCYLEDAAPSDPLAFHRDLEHALRRLREWSSHLGCSRTLHRPEPEDL
jgi:hypothetical protein